MAGLDPRLSGLDFPTALGLWLRQPKQPKIVMAGLDPAIHAVPPALKPGICIGGTSWMPGSSPGMTIVVAADSGNTTAFA